MKRTTQRKKKTRSAANDSNQKYEHDPEEQAADDTRMQIFTKLDAKEKQVRALQDEWNRQTTAASVSREQYVYSTLCVKETVKEWIDGLKAFEREVLEEIHDDAEQQTQYIQEKAEEMEMSGTALTEAIQDVKLKLCISSDALLLEQKPDILSQIDSIVVPASPKPLSVLKAMSLKRFDKDRVKQILQMDDDSSLNEMKSPTGSQKAHQETIHTQKEPSLQRLHVLRVVKRFPLVESVCDIAPVSGSKTWVGTTSSILLMNADGEILLAHGHDNDGGTSVTSTSSGDALYFTRTLSFRRFVIRMITQDGEVTEKLRMQDPFDIIRHVIICVRSLSVGHIVLEAKDVGSPPETYHGNFFDDYERSSYSQVARCSVYSMTEVSDGRLVAINDQNQIVLLDRDGALMMVLASSFGWVWKQFCSALSFDSKNRVIVGNPNGNQVRVYELKGYNFSFVQEYSIEAISSGIYSVAVDDLGLLWIGTKSDGVIIAEIPSTSTQSEAVQQDWT